MADAVVTKERFAQAVRANLPVNPVSGIEIVGQNLTRLLEARREHGWGDPRFISELDAQRMGWTINLAARSVETQWRAEGGPVVKVRLFNAQDVQGMPPVSAMLAMNEAEFAAMQGRAPEAAVEGEVRIGPAPREQAVAQERSEPTAPAVEAPAAGASGRYAVMVPYWLDKMHNVEGIAIANELNKLIHESGLERNPAGIQKLLDGRERAWMFEARVVPEEELENDPHWRADAARPHTLLDGALVRDGLGAYRPRAGGLPVIEDKGDSLVAKSKSLEAIKASVELAKSKGWKTIELSGDQRKLGDWWLEAKLAGLEVANYSPSVEDEKRLAERMPKEVAAPAPAPEKVVETTPEIVEMRPYIDAAGQQRTATIVYTVTQEGQAPQQFGSAKEAAAWFARTPAEAVPTVVRSVMRADGQVDAEVMVAGATRAKGTAALVKSADAAIDAEFAQALGEAIEAEKVHDGLDKAAAPQMYSGLILRIEGNEVVQKVGRDPSQIVRHDIGKLSAVPRIGEVADIAFGKDGIGIVAEQGQSRSVQR